jgi:hypothetical protein
MHRGSIICEHKVEQIAKESQEKAPGKKFGEEGKELICSDKNLKRSPKPIV